MGFLNLIGVAPKLRIALNQLDEEVTSLQKIINGDVTDAIDLAEELSAEEVNGAITEDTKYTEFATVYVVDSDGEVNTMFNGSIGVSVAKSSTSGVVALHESATAIAFVDGEGIIGIDFTGEWEKDDTVTLTLSGSIAGTTISDTATITFKD